MLSVKNLTLTAQDGTQILKGVSFDLYSGEKVALVGKSGSGKSAIAHAILQLFSRRSGFKLGGSINYQGLELLDASDNIMQTIRGSHIGMVFQEALAALNPTMTVGQQILEAILHRQILSGEPAKARVIELLTFIGLSDPQRRYHQYPHEFSGGMRQRIVIAIALACEPKLLIADEPTTALDVTIQAQILDLLDSIQAEKNMGILLITHDLAIVSQFCDRVLIMHEGEIVDEGSIEHIFYDTTNPYTRQLVQSVKENQIPEFIHE